MLGSEEVDEILKEVNQAIRVADAVDNERVLAGLPRVAEALEQEQVEYEEGGVW